MEQTVGVVKEVGSAIFRVRDFSFICTPGEKLEHNDEPMDLETNAISSNPILNAGQHSFNIIVAWSLGCDGSITEDSMLGLAVQRASPGDEPIVIQLELRLVNVDPSLDVAMRSSIGQLKWTLGWYPSPYASRREQADGFLPLRNVLNPANGWLVEDTLTVECKMTVVVSHVATVASPIGSAPDPLQDLCKDMSALFKSHEFADVQIRCNDGTIEAHSNILAARSPVFRAMWSNSAMKEGASKTVDIEDVDHRVALRLVQFMYTASAGGELANDGDTVALLQAAHKYEVNVLVELCAVALASRLNVDIVIDRLMVADLLGLDGLRKACLEYIIEFKTNLQAVQTTPAFGELIMKRPHLAGDILAAAFPPSASAGEAAPNRGFPEAA